MLEVVTNPRVLKIEEYLLQKKCKGEVESEDRVRRVEQSSLLAAKPGRMK